MYHFTIIEETSIESETKLSAAQEKELLKVVENSSKTIGILKKTVYFLHKVIDQPNCVRIFISKN